MSDSFAKIEAAIREKPLAERIEESQRRIGAMCREGRGPRMRVPVSPDDDDIFIGTTLRDCARLAAQLADARADAERYRWLREHPVFQVKELPNELELLDASIDRYMAGQETEE